jgi:hypothetical protein
MGLILEMCQSGNYDTDKFYEGSYAHPKSQPSRHTYVESAYDTIFPRLKDSAKNVLEIGAYSGGSHLLWRDYFSNAQIVAMDINPVPALENQDRIDLRICDAYCTESVNMFEDGFFDVIIDDGPHTYESMEYTLRHYSPKLKDGGILVIEDIGSIDWVRPLALCLPEKYQQIAEVYDLRANIGRHDDILIVVDTGAK